MKKSLLSQIFLFLLFVSIVLKPVYGQTNTFYDVWRGVLWAVFGELPAPCVNLEDPLCWECMVVGKVLPLIIFSIIGCVLTAVFLYFLVYKKDFGSTLKEHLYEIVVFVVVVGIFLMHVLEPMDFYNKFGNVTSLRFWLLKILPLSIFTWLAIMGYRPKSSVERTIIGIVIVAIVVAFVIAFNRPEVKQYKEYIENLINNCFWV